MREAAVITYRLRVNAACFVLRFYQYPIRLIDIWYYEH